MTAPDLNNYAGSEGLLSARRIGAANSDTTINDTNEHTIDTILNVAVGPGATISRAVELFWSGGISVTAASDFRVVTRAYWMAGSTFTLASANNIGPATQQIHTSIQWISNIWTVSLSPGTYSFGISCQLPLNGATSFTVHLDSTTNYYRYFRVCDVGSGSLVGS